jgi:Na+/phosphate symporter
MEHSADILAHQVVKPMLKRHRKEGAFISTHKKVLLDMSGSMSRAHELSASVFLRQDPNAAREIIQEKVDVRNTERLYVRAREVDNTTTSLLNPDIDDDLRLMREMGRVLGHSSAIAYELLENAGQLQPRVG